ncbi:MULTISPECIES: hypothetical protein [unclassified Paenibacillus]|uniref:hypothetical protein n=1 Tax=unclassified Paenibacillus TaxID=185978 RepID=UPI000AB3300B|nr:MULTISPECIES: hypothetical protein [unclassified Paenibacillus]
MAKGNGRDKNLGNVADDLQQSAVNSHSAQQTQQKANDRRHRDVHNHHKETDMDPSH